MEMLRTKQFTVLPANSIAPDINTVKLAPRRTSTAPLWPAISKGWLWLYESGTYVKFTLAGADMIARMVSAPMGFHERQK